MRARNLFTVALSLLIVCGCKKTPLIDETPNEEPVGEEQVVAIPELPRWEAQMVQYGKKHCQSLKDTSRPFDPLLADTYYDAQLVFLQIEEYTKDPFWGECANAAKKVYRDKYVLPNEGKVPGYWNFSLGMVKDFAKTKDQKSKEGVLLLAKNAAYSGDLTPPSETESSERSREVAYAILAHLGAEEVGAIPRTRVKVLVAQALKHLRQWFDTEDHNIKTFMVGLTAQALIKYEEKKGNDQILPALTSALESLWQKMWVPNKRAFKYVERSDDPKELEPSPDLNLLLAPAYAWVYHKTGDKEFRDRADQIFAGGVAQAWLDNGKQFNQNYRWSFDYVKWRQEPPKSSGHY